MRILAIAAALTFLPAGLAQDQEAQKKRLVEIIRAMEDLFKKIEADPAISDKDGVFRDKSEKLETEGLKLGRALTGGDEAKLEALMEPLTREHAPTLYADMNRTRISSNERNATGSIKTLKTAEADFRANDRDGNRVNDFWVGDVYALHAFVPFRPDGTMNELVHANAIRLIEISIAKADSAPLKLANNFEPAPEKPQPKAGYLFTALVEYEKEAAKWEKYHDGKYRNPDRFGFCAYPAEHGKTGKLTFMLNEDNTMWRKDTAGKPPRGFPLDPRKDGWTKLD